MNFDPGQFETEQVFYASKDGTRIPMALVHRKGMKRDGQTPTILYAYGGFNVSVLPEVTYSGMLIINWWLRTLRAEVFGSVKIWLV